MTLAWEALAAARCGVSDIRSFEHWVYESTDLETAVGKARYLELIGFDFTQAAARRELANLLDEIFAERQRSWREHVAAYLARGYLARRIDLPTIANVLAGFWSDGIPWAPTEFAYINSELDSIPLPAHYPLWDGEALARKLVESQPRMQAFEEAARAAAEDLLNQLQLLRETPG
jgi:hypothetical protein